MHACMQCHEGEGRDQPTTLPDEQQQHGEQPLIKAQLNFDFVPVCK